MKPATTLGLFAFASGLLIAAFLLLPTAPSEEEKWQRKREQQQAEQLRLLTEATDSGTTDDPEAAARNVSWYQQKFLDDLAALDLLEPLATATVVGFSRLEKNPDSGTVYAQVMNAAGIDGLDWAIGAGDSFPVVLAEPWNNARHGNGQGLLFVLAGNPPELVAVKQMRLDGGREVSAMQVIHHYLEIRPAASALITPAYGVVGSLQLEPPDRH